MQKSVRLLIAVAVIGVGMLGWRWLFPSPERVIRSRLLQLAQTASFTPNDGTLVKAYKVERLPGFFSSDVVIGFEIPGDGDVALSGRDQVMEAVRAALVSGRAGGLKIQLRDISVTLGADRQSAVANLTGTATVAGQSDFIVQEFNFRLKKLDGKWLICRVEAVKTLS